MMKRSLFFMAIAGTALASTATAQSLSTTFAGGNGLSSAPDVTYFDVAIGANPLRVTAFDTNTDVAAGDRFTIEVYLTPGGFAGNTTNPGVWTSMTTGTGLGNGFGNTVDAVMIDRPFLMDANTVYGVAFVYTSYGAGGGVNYTNGTGANQAYSNVDLGMRLGSSGGSLFSGGLFDPRVWNGTIYYDVIPAPASLALLGLGGLVATRRRR
ncbi:PEP-CTERM sorting domain-containing protein [Roseiflexus sp. AH-315-K22]|nr:PEP-CTERM sorting domain-containing protein [Roseiflexus sp. AH-315-K22]